MLADRSTHCDVMCAQALDDMEEVHAKRSNAGAIQDDEDETRKKEEQVNHIICFWSMFPAVIPSPWRPKQSRGTTAPYNMLQYLRIKTSRIY